MNIHLVRHVIYGLRTILWLDIYSVARPARAKVAGHLEALMI